MTRFVSYILIVSVAVVVVGCAVGPNYSAPKERVAGSFAPAGITPTTAPTTAPSAIVVDLASWWTSLNDKELDSLVDRAIGSNLDLQIALNRLQESREVQAAATGTMLPAAEFSAAAGRGTGSNSTRGRISPPLNAATNTKGLTEITHVIGFDAAWEIDLFGRLRRQLEAYQANTQATLEARNAVLISLVADVARAYTELRGRQLRLQIAQENLAQQERSAQLARSRLAHGLGNNLDEALAQRQLAATRSRLAPLQALVADSQRQLALLLGMSPDALGAELGTVAPLPDAPAEPSTGAPADLLRRRPDIRVAERQLAAQTALVGVAAADLFPRLALTGGGGWQGQGLGRVPVQSSDIWSIGPSFSMPLLDFGRLDALVKAQDFRVQEQLLAYRRTVIQAIGEVENAQTNYAAQRDSQLQLADAVARSQTAVRLALERYNRGLSDFLNVLDAQRQLYDLQDQLAVTQQQTLVQFIALCKALGGGWENYPAPALPEAPRPAIVAAGSRLLHPGAEETPAKSAP